MKTGTIERKRERWFYLLISPWIIGFLLFQGGPLLGVFILSLGEWPFPNPPSFVGLGHFQAMGSDPLLWKTLFNSAYYALGTVPAGIGLGLLLAMLVNRAGRIVAFFRTLYFLPIVVSSVALTLLWGWIFNPRFGLVNRALALLGVQGPGWFYDESWAMPALILMSIWLLGVNMVIYLAALQNIPADLHEAAELDGAGRAARFRFVTWPMLSPVTFYLVVVNFIGSFQVFTPSYILTQGGPKNATLTLPLYIYLNAFSWGKLGYASAISVVLFLLVMGLTIWQFRLADRWVFYAGGRG